MPKGNKVNGNRYETVRLSLKRTVFLIFQWIRVTLANQLKTT